MVGTPDWSVIATPVKSMLPAPQLLEANAVKAMPGGVKSLDSGVKLPASAPISEAVSPERVYPSKSVETPGIAAPFASTGVATDG